MFEFFHTIAVGFEVLVEASSRAIEVIRYGGDHIATILVLLS